MSCDTGRTNLVIPMGATWARTITYYDPLALLASVTATGTKGVASATITNGSASGVTFTAGEVVQFGNLVAIVAATVTVAAASTGTVTLTTALGSALTGVAVSKAGPFNLTGYTARMQVRAKSETTSTILSLTSSPAAGITLGGAAGTIALALTAAQLDTATLDLSTITAPEAWVSEELPDGGVLRGFGLVGVYDLEIVSGAVVTRILQGQVVFDAEVTR